MKRLLASLLLITAATFTSCQKEELPAPSPAASQSQTIHVEYKVRAVSGRFSVEYLAPGADNKLELKKDSYDRNEISFSFDCIRGEKVSVKAFNTMPSQEEVVVEIYVNNALVQSAAANAPGTSALAEGIFY